MPSQDIELFFTWFQSHGGYIDASSMDIIEFPASEGGRGAVALKDIPEGHLMFSIPPSLVLSTQTCPLPVRFGLDDWRKLKLHEGWAGLILCVMWEATQGSQSKWSVYLDSLPQSFDTPMFWNQEDLDELKGTSVVEKLGKDQAEKDYQEKVLPAIQSRPDLFATTDVPAQYSLEKYHLMGSRILSRSFTLEADGEQEDDHQESEIGNTSTGSAMEVDNEHGHPSSDDTDSAAQEEVEEEEVAIIPMADILNARYKSENVKLFYEPDCLKMVSIKSIKAGEQIWNTYGDPPNAVLLRGYGHVDYLPLPEGGFGNPGDVVEIRADLLVSTIVESHPNLAEENLNERIDWWLDEGGDDVFILESDPEIPPPLLSFTRLILLTSEWTRAQQKGKPPKPKQDTQVLEILKETLVKRLEQYSTTIQDDEALLNDPAWLTLNRRNAVIVRVGEKRILHRFIDSITSLIQTTSASAESLDGHRNLQQKRKATDGSPESKKRSKR